MIYAIIFQLFREVDHLDLFLGRKLLIASGITSLSKFAFLRNLRLSKIMKRHLLDGDHQKGHAWLECLNSEIPCELVCFPQRLLLIILHAADFEMA